MPYGYQKLSHPKMTYPIKLQKIKCLTMCHSSRMAMGFPRHSSMGFKEFLDITEAIDRPITRKNNGVLVCNCVYSYNPVGGWLVGLVEPACLQKTESCLDGVASIPHSTVKSMQSIVCNTSHIVKSMQNQPHSQKYATPGGTTLKTKTSD